MPNATIDEKQWSNYQKWSAGTVLTLCNVTWDSSYQNIVAFDTQAQLDAWIDSKPNAPITKFSLAKFNRDVVVDTPLNAAMRFNYLRAVNPPMPIPGDVSRTYYYFINGVEYLGPKATKLSLQLDVWSTFGFDITFGRCFVDQGHIGIANTNQFDQYGRSYLTVPEGLDTGNEYRIVHKERTKILDAAGDANTDPGYDVLVSSTLDLTQPPGTVDNPGFKTSTGGVWNGLPSGADFYLFPTGFDFRAFLTKYTAFPWITQSITSITLIPNMTRYNPGYNYGTDLGDGTFHMYKATIDSGTTYTPQPKTVANFVNWRNAQFLKNILGPAYQGLMKFFTYPYMVIELSAHNGSPVLMRPEAWQDPDAKVTEIAAFVPPGQRIAMYPARYNADAETLSGTQTDNLVATNQALIDDNGDAFDIAVVMDSFPTLPIVNNMGIAYLAQNRNGIAFSFQNASWNQTRAIAAANAGANVANAQIGNTGRQAEIANRAATQQMVVQSTVQGANAAINATTGVAGGAARGAVGGPAGAAVGAGMGAVSGAGDLAGAAVNILGNVASTEVGNAARSASASSDISTASTVRDTNLDFQQFAAQGDYAMAIRGIQATNQDAQLTQPSVSGQFGGDAFNLVQGLAGYVLTWKMPNLGYLRRIGNYWLRWGYMIQQYITPPPRLKCMTTFTYWRMSEAYIATGAIPEGFKTIIRGIFERGVTVWNDPDDIATAQLTDNAPLNGISY